MKSNKANIGVRWASASVLVIGLASGAVGVAAPAKAKAPRALRVAQTSNTLKAGSAATTTLRASTSSSVAGANKIDAKKLSKKVTFVWATEASKDFLDPENKGEIGTENSMSATYEPIEDYKFSVAVVNSFKFVGFTPGNEPAQYRDVAFSLARTAGPFLGTEKTPVKFILTLPKNLGARDNKQFFGLGAESTLAYEMNSQWSSTTLVRAGWNLMEEEDTFKNVIETEIRYAFNDKVSTALSASHSIKANTKNVATVTNQKIGYGVGLGYSANSMLDLGVNVSGGHVLVDTTTATAAPTSGTSKTAEPPPKDMTKVSFLSPEELSYGASVSLRF